MSYQPGIPTGRIPLNQDYLNLQGNFTSLNNQWTVDHVPLTSNGVPPNQPNGYHTNIHLVPNSTTSSNPPNNYPLPITPTSTGGYGQVWSAQISDGYNTDEALYFLTGGNKNLQLTRNFLPSATTTGYTFLPGGLVLMWGLTTGIPVNGTLPITFPKIQGSVAFSTNCFNVSVTGIRSNSGGDGIFVLAGSVSINGFTFRNGSGSITSAYWMAIGN